MHCIDARSTRLITITYLLTYLLTYVQIGDINATAGSSFSQQDVNNGHVVYIHDDSDADNDSLIYGLGLIYGAQPEVDSGPSRFRYFSHTAVLPVIIEQVGKLELYTLAS